MRIVLTLSAGPTFPTSVEGWLTEIGMDKYISVFSTNSLVLPTMLVDVDQLLAAKN